MKKVLTGVAAAALLSFGVFTLAAGSASARVVCNDDGDCWHTDRAYHYGSDVHARYHPDNWYFHNDWDHDHDHHWRGHREGRGYWRNGVWITF
jgi:hypothetical protein